MTDNMKNIANWKTTAAGCIAAVGKVLQGHPGNVGLFGNLLEMAGLLATGFFAQDAGKSK